MEKSNLHPVFEEITNICRPKNNTMNEELRKQVESRLGFYRHYKAEIESRPKADTLTNLTNIALIKVYNAKIEELKWFL